MADSGFHLSRSGGLPAPSPAPAPGWSRALPVALEGAAFAAPLSVGATALLFAKIGPAFIMPGIAAALLGMALMHLVTAASGRPMVYATRVMEAIMVIGFLDQFILKMPGWGLADTPEHRLLLAMAVSVGCALLLPLFHAFGLRRFARMIPAPVFAGFGTALSITVLISQLGVLRTSLGQEGPWFVAIALLALLVAVATQRWMPRWPAGLVGIVAGSAAALAVAWFALHQFAAASYGSLQMMLPVALVPWSDVWAPEVATAAVVRDVLLASATLALLVFVNGVVNEEAVSRIDDAAPRPRDWLPAGLACLASTLLGSLVPAPSLAPTRAAVRVGRLGWRSMVLIGALVLLALGSNVLRWIPPATICGLLLFDAWMSFHWPSLALARQWMRGRELAASEKEDLTMIGAVVLAVVLFNIVIGVFVGVFAGLALHAWRNGQRQARSVLTGEQARSNCARSRSETARLAEEAHRLRFVELEGALFFGAAGALQALLRAQCAPGNVLVVDWSHVLSIDSTVASVFARLVTEAHTNETEVAISGLGKADRRVLETLRAAGVQARVFPDADRALEWAENQLLQARAATAGGGDVTSLQDALGLLRGLSSEQRALVQPLFEQRMFSAGETVFEAESRNDELMVILHGSVDILLPRSDGASGRDIRLARLRRGAMLGELSFLDSAPRAAKAVASEELLVGVLSRERFDQLARDWPEAGQRLLMNLALDLALRLRKTNRLAVSNLG